MTLVCVYINWLQQLLFHNRRVNTFAETLVDQSALQRIEISDGAV